MNKAINLEDLYMEKLPNLKFQKMTESNYYHIQMKIIYYLHYIQIEDIME